MRPLKFLMFILYPAPPYDLSKLLAILDRYAHPTVNISYQGAYWRVLQVQDALALIHVEQQGEALGLQVMAQTGEIDPDVLLERVRHLLDVESDRRAFFDFASQHSELREVVEPLAGLPNLRTASLFEALTETIIEQQISWINAQRAQRWLVEWAGNQLAYDGKTFYAFPTPAQIATASIDDLKPLKITFRRMGLLIDLARQIASGELNLENLSPDTAYDDLLKIKGIGHWTALVIVSRALGIFPAIPHNDVALQAAVNFYFHSGNGRIPAQTMLDTLGRYGDYAGLAAHYTLLRWVLDRYPVRDA